jgi:soluble lytic murein transglycosylase-like protein
VGRVLLLAALAALTACERPAAPDASSVTSVPAAPSVFVPAPDPPPPATAPAPVVTPAPVSVGAVPPAAMLYREDLLLQSRIVWGITAPVATFAAQVHQESSWRPDARSPYANGLAQFTPSTADWISGAYPAELGVNQPFNSAWALRALVRYDKHLWDRQSHYASECDRFAFTLADYNGGAGWRIKRQRASAAPGDYAITSRINPGILASNQRENEGYPRRILGRWQPVYAGWGLGVKCSAAQLL